MEEDNTKTITESTPEPSPGKRKSRASDVEPRSSAKRQRVPVARFQSPLDDLEPKFKSDKEEKKDDNILLYKKSCFLAVRGAEGSFYLCRAAQNIYKKSKRLRIQWLSLEKNPDVYKFDYVDSTEMETVLTEINMIKVAKDSFKLPSDEKRRIEKILDRAIRVEQGIATADEVEEEALDDNDDDDEVTSEDEDEETTPKRGRKKSPSKGKQAKSTTPKQRKKGKVEKSKAVKQNMKAEKKKGPDRHLKPNPKIKVLEKDPFFETKEKMPKLSPRMATKLAFRAVNMNDADMLKEILAKKEGLTKFGIGRSVHDERTPLDMAMEKGETEMIKLLTREFWGKNERKPPPAPLISSMSTGRYNFMSLGVANIRALNVSRGAKQGNDAFLKETDDGSDPDRDMKLTKKWMSKGVSVDAIETFLSELVAVHENRETRDDLLHSYIIDHVFEAVMYGHRHLAGKYIAEAERLGGFGVNFLHKEVLTFEKENLRDIILAASVRKKPFGNIGITPLHCAAINPNVKYITRLLSIEPDINMQTKSRARPIHFAAACEGTGPLEFLLNRHASPYEADTSGDIPLHFASRSGRAKNIDVLIKHAQGNVDDSLNPKWGVGCINRPNRFSFAPLHLAVKEGHMDAIRTLMKHGADINKPLSAGQDKVTPLMLAAQRGDLNVVRSLIQSGASVEILDKFKRTALTHAVINGCGNVASYLLLLGADPDRVDSSNNSLVHYASAYGWQSCLKLLIKDSGAKPDVPNDWQTTPISLAFLMGNHGLVEYLFNHKGVDINFLSETGRTLISIAAGARLVTGLDDQIRYLIENCKADATIADVNGMSPLHYLAQNNIKLGGNYRKPEIDKEAQSLSVKIAEIFFNSGCDVMLKNKDGKTPLMLAIEQVNVDLVKCLVERGAFLTPEQNKDEKTVLHLMAENCCLTDLRPVLKILVEKKLKKPITPKTVEKDVKENGKINAVNASGDGQEDMDVTPAETVSAENEVKPTEKPKENNVNGEKESEAMEVEDDTSANKEIFTPDESEAPWKKMSATRDFLGFTPLLRACQVYKDFKVNSDDDKKNAANALGFVEELLNLSGADVNDVVGPKNMPDLKEPQYSEDGKCSALHFMMKASAENNKAEIGPGLKLIMGYSPNPNLLDINDKSPLVLAVEGNKKMAVKALLEKGADPNVVIKVPKDTVTPLMLAAERGAFEIMSILIKAKATVAACGESMRTPMHILVTNRACEDETIAMVQTLLEAGSNVNAENKDGRTPLHLAVIHNEGHSDTSNSLEEFLLDRGANIFAKDSSQNMPLHEAVKKSGVEPIELCSLLTSAMRDQRVDETNSTGYTPLLYAASSGATICCMHLLQRGANIEAKDHKGNTALNLAVYGGYDSCAIMLMQRKASVSHPIVVSLPVKKEEPKKEEEKVKKRPCLTWRPKRQWECDQMRDIPGKTVSIFESAIYNDLTGVAHMLLDALGVPTEVIESALNLSKFFLALRLLRRIPDASRLQAKNKDGQNLFHVLASKTSNRDPDLQIKVAGALLEKGVPLNERDKFGMTPLMWAALKHQSIPLAKFLIENDLRFDPKVKDFFGRDTLAAFMWDYKWVSDLFKADLIESWLKLLLEDGKMSLDTRYDHPLPDPLLLGATISSKQPDYFETKNTSKTTPLIFAIRNYDFGMAKFMLLSGANPNFPDSDGMTPIMHAVIMNDLKMVKLLLNYSYSAESDCVIEVGKPQLVSQSSRQIFPISFDVVKEKNPDDLIDEEEAPEEDDENVSLSKHTEENEDSVILEEDEGLNMSEVDENENDWDEEENDDSDHDTDVMEDDDADYEPPETESKKEAKLGLARHISSIAKEKAYAYIEKTSAVDLSVRDKNQWTALHHAVCALDYASFDNAEIVYVLGKASAPLDAENDKGQTPLALAQKNDSVKIVKVLNQLLVLPPYNKTSEPVKSNPSSFEVQELMVNKVQPDYNADAKTMLEKEPVDNVEVECEKVDDHCEIKSTGELVNNATTNIPYHVVLTKVDVSAGYYGMFNFYKLQIIKHKVKKIFILFTRWGRIGDRGQFQHTPFQTLEEASKEFCKVYKSKTGNDWNQKTSFINRPKKYRLMNAAEKRPKTKKINFNFESSPATTLPEPIYDVVNEMSSLTMFDASVDHFHLDKDIMPFGRIKREVILEARKILTDISEVIDKAGKLKNNLTPQTEAEYQSCSEELIKLTNEFYHLIPISGFENESIRPIVSKMTLRSQTRLLNELLDLEIANTILLGANLKKLETNYVDYIYSCLGCSLQPLPETDPETQLILTNIHASVPTAHINRIFKISRDGENERLANTNLPNHQLLWHGSSMSNFISILSRGLLVAPPEVPWSGHLFGEGIYFADTFLKSMHYCHNHNPKSHCKVMLLCEVALGNSKIDVSHSDEDHLDSDINSLKILGGAAPIADFDARLPYGASLSLGQIQKMKYEPPARIAHNEYIIHNADQIALRYLVLFNG